MVMCIASSWLLVLVLVLIWKICITLWGREGGRKATDGVGSRLFQDLDQRETGLFLFFPAG